MLACYKQGLHAVLPPNCTARHCIQSLACKTCFSKRLITTKYKVSKTYIAHSSNISLSTPFLGSFVEPNKTDIPKFDRFSTIACKASQGQMDTLLFYGKGPGARNEWKAAFEGTGIPLQVVFDDDPIPDPQAVRFAVGWRPNKDLFRQLPNLVAVQSLGAGVDGFLQIPNLLPEGVQLLRIVDLLMGQRMATWSLVGVLNAQRYMGAYAKAQAAHKWDRTVEPASNRDNVDMRCGVLGMGVMGGSVARALQLLGYPVSCWTRTPRDPEGPPGTLPMRNYAGREQLKDFVSQCDALICMLPLTPDTTGIINAELLSWLPKGATFINGARGGHVAEADLLEALNSGQVGSCLLDVFHTEPLPEDSPFWIHPNVTITPHTASLTNIPNAVAQTLQNREQALGLPAAKGYVENSVVNVATGY